MPRPKRQKIGEREGPTDGHAQSTKATKSNVKKMGSMGVKHRATRSTTTVTTTIAATTSTDELARPNPDLHADLLPYEVSDHGEVSGVRIKRVKRNDGRASVITQRKMETESESSSSVLEVEQGRHAVAVKTPASTRSKQVRRAGSHKLDKGKSVAKTTGVVKRGNAGQSTLLNKGLESSGAPSESATALSGDEVMLEKDLDLDLDLSTDCSDDDRQAEGHGTTTRTAATPLMGSALRRLAGMKRRARQPSILGTAQKPSRHRGGDDNGLIDLEKEDDFRPVDESTPLRRAGTRTARATVSANIVTIGDAQSSPPPLTLPPSTPPPMRESSPALSSTPSQAPASQEPLVALSSPAPVANSPSVDSSPLSSPGLPSPGRLNDIRLENFRPQSPLTQGSDSTSLPSSPPSLTHSPNYPRNARAGPTTRRPASPTNLPTAQLQALLPRRRTRAAPRDTFDMELSSEEDADAPGLDSDDDELSHINARAPSRRPSSKTKAQAKIKAVSNAKSKNNVPKAKALPNPITKAGPQKRTYGTRAAQSDKENETSHAEEAEEEEPDVIADTHDNADAEQLDSRLGTELIRAKRKFAEVDKWELDFEEMTASSSFDGR